MRRQVPAFPSSHDSGGDRAYLRTTVLAIAIALLALAGCGDDGGDDRQPVGGDEGGAPRSETTRVEVIENSGEGGGFDAKAIYESEAPGVVTVVSLFGSGGLDSVLEGEGGGGVGSGFVLDGKGEIATNAHVVTTGEGDAIRRAREVYVEFADGNTVEAEVVGADPNADIALLRIDPSGLRLRPLPLGESAGVEVGEPVAAIGSPFGEEQSLSVGVVSAIDRSIESLTQFAISGAIQTDAAINPGNSGGPLVDGEGRVIGVNQQIKSTSGGGEGVGFAVPVDAVKRSLDMLREDGEADYAYLGVSSVELYPQLVEKFELDVDKGAWVQQVNPGGPAEQAGIRGGGNEVEFQAQTFHPGGDIITKVDGKAIETSAQLADLIADYPPGEEVPLEIHRDGDVREIEVKLGERPLGDVGG
jgi:S1-C subfamily serine protease